MNYLAIDIGGTFIKYGLVDHSGNLGYVKKVKTPQNIDDFLSAIFNIISKSYHIRGIGISLPGRIDTERGIIYFGGTLQFLHGLALKSKIEEEFRIPTELSNDAKAAALSELWLGNLKDVKNGAAIILGTGVGGGLILNGELYQGSHFQAGELSFMTNDSYLKDINDMVGLSSSAIEFIKSCNKILNNSDLTDGKRVFKAIQIGDNLEVLALFNSYCKRLANLIINLQAMLDLETVVIGGGISNQNILIENINMHYQTLHHNYGIFEYMIESVTIAPCKFRNDANLLGAIYQLIIKLDEDSVH